METRLKGQEVVIRITRGGRAEATITAVKDFTLSFDIDQLDEGYLGEKQNRFDEVAVGSSGTITVTPEGPEVLRMIDFIVKRAARNPSIDIANSAVNVTARFEFPDGRRPKLIVRDLKFGTIPINVGDRKSFVSISFPFKAPLPKLVEA